MAARMRLWSCTLGTIIGVGQKSDWKSFDTATRPDITWFGYQDAG